jgi:CheY-like chemotaxis protein
VIPRRILVVDADDARRNKMITELNGAKFIALEARSGSDGIVRALRYLGLDLIVMSSNLRDMDSLDVLDKLQADSRTKDVPVVIVGSAAQAADETWRNLYQEKVKGMAAIPEGAGLPSEEFLATVRSSFAGEDPSEIARYARSATILDALAGTDTGNALFNWNSLTKTLTALLTADLPEDPPVRTNAIRALGNLRDPSGLADLITFFAWGAPAAHRAAAGMAIAEITRANSTAFTDDQFHALLKGTKDADADVRKSAFAAIGSSSVTAAQAYEVAKMNRPGAGGGDMGGEEGCASEEGCGCCGG